jgi:hypothetical protein
MDLELMTVGAAGRRRHASAPKSGYASTYYPRHTDVVEPRITLAAGQESRVRTSRSSPSWRSSGIVIRIGR